MQIAWPRPASRPVLDAHRSKQVLALFVCTKAKARKLRKIPVLAGLNLDGGVLFALFAFRLFHLALE